MNASELKQAFSELSAAKSSTPRANLPSPSTVCEDPPPRLATLTREATLALVLRIYGSNESLLQQNLNRLKLLCDVFLRNYGDGQVELLRAPARINILGEHVDYVSYLATSSLTFGSRERDMFMLYRASEQNIVRGSSTSSAYPPSSFNDLEALPPLTGNVDDDWLSFLYQTTPPSPHWLNYVQGSVNYFRIKSGSTLKGFDFVIDSTIPAGGGASSSSALVVLAGAAIRNVNHASFAADELARDSSRAEWFVGTRGGSMDHVTICLAQDSRAVLINYSANQTSRVSLPASPFQWLTFFTQPADKGREIMIEYNERAAVSRVLIPEIIESWRATQPPLHNAWCEAVNDLASGSTVAADRVVSLMESLPETLSLATLEREFPAAFKVCLDSFPALTNERERWPVKIRSRALHHIGEIERVSAATLALSTLNEESTDEENENVMRTIGGLLTQSHLSLKNLYEVSTPDVEELLTLINSDAHVYGARLMGGGFGGNVLVLTTQEHSKDLVERVQEKYYEPQARNGVQEGSVMISTPGNGLARLRIEDLWREKLQDFCARDPGEIAVEEICAFIDSLPVQANSFDVWPIVVAAGKGSRAAATGLQTAKPLASIANRPSVVHVLENIRQALGETRRPIVIASPDTELSLRQALENVDVSFVIQSKALGTGDAVLSVREALSDFSGLALVIWSTQPVIRPQTILRSLKLASLFDNYDLILPTTLRERPYAPVYRNSGGRVLSAAETHLQGAASMAFGETNIGMFMLKSRSMFDTLTALRESHWNEVSQSYDRAGGELGFPNEIVNAFVSEGKGVFACPIADPREEQGIKRLEDVERCEQFISELEEERH